MHKLFAGIVVLSLSAFVPVPPAEDKDPSDVTGSWIVFEGIEGGKKVDPDAFEEKWIITFKDGKYTETIAGKLVEAGTYSVDASKKPLTIDFSITEGEEKGKTQLGIVMIQKDVMTLSLSPFGSTERPKRFDGTDDGWVQKLRRTE
jgi:uncharacterized protein (TIGR03067 family)